MMKTYLLIFAAAFSLCSCAQTPRLFALDGKQLRSNRSGVINKNPELQPAYDQLIKDANKALTEGPYSVMEKKNMPPSGNKHDYMSLAPYYWPDPTKPDGVPYIRKDGETNPEVKTYKDKEYMPKLCELVPTLALAYYFSGDESYAKHASLLLRTWFLDTATRMNPNLNYAQAMKGHNTGRGAGLIDTRHFIKLIDGINLLKGSKNWSRADQEGMQKWFSEFLNWMQTSQNGVDEMDAENNHGTWYDAQRLAIALFVDSTSLAGKIVENAKGRLDRQMDAEGKFPKEMERTTALHYNLFNLEAFFTIASLAEKLNIDLWQYQSPSGGSLKKGFDFLYPFITDEEKWTGQQINVFEFEEAYPVLFKATGKFNCGRCLGAVEKLAEEKYPRLRLHLMY